MATNGTLCSLSEGHQRTRDLSQSLGKSFFFAKGFLSVFHLLCPNLFISSSLFVSFSIVSSSVDAHYFAFVLVHIWGKYVAITHT